MLYNYLASEYCENSTLRCSAGNLDLANSSEPEGRTTGTAGGSDCASDVVHNTSSQEHLLYQTCMAKLLWRVALIKHNFFLTG